MNFIKILFSVPVAVTKKNTKTAEAVTKTWKAPQKDAKNNVRMPPLKEQVEKEGPKGGNDEAVEEDKEGDLGSAVQTSHLSGSHQPGLVLFTFNLIIFSYKD